MNSEIIKKFPDRRILVIGDMIADIYLTGLIARISREAPVLVLEQEKEKVVAGGAANVVNNVATLGGQALACGPVGDDRDAAKLAAILQQNGVDTAGLLPGFADTIVKTRVIAAKRSLVSQQIVRIDRGGHQKLTADAAAKLDNYLRQTIPTVHGVVISDYDYGLFPAARRRLIIDAAKEHDIPIIVDSRAAINDFTGITYVKQNDAELAAALDRELPDVAAIVAGAKELLAKLQAVGILVTRGADGMTLVERNSAVTHIPVADKSEVFDVSGAGDTCVAAFILALTSGAAPAEAARLANIAAGIAVRKRGTATVSAAELAAKL